jgi:hypothetical protein
MTTMTKVTLKEGKDISRRRVGTIVGFNRSSTRIPIYQLLLQVRGRIMRVVGALSSTLYEQEILKFEDDTQSLAHCEPH